MLFLRNLEVKRFFIFLLILNLVFVVSGYLIAGFLCANLIAIICILMDAVFFLFTRWRYQQISELSHRIDRILHGDSLVHFDTFREGELAILQDEIYKMTIRLREQAKMLSTDKNFLADSLADISHQIRTPLTSLNLIVAMLKNKNITKERRWELTNEIEKLLERIDWLISMLLKFSKLDAGTVLFRKDKVLLSDLIHTVIEPFLIPMDLRNQTLTIKIEGQDSFLGDFPWSVEAIGNILKNCMEHTPEGGEICILGSENPLFTEICIEDNGQGVAKDDLPHLFERFYRGENAVVSSYGIGLSLARMIIKEQNGIIVAENKDDKGMRFFVRYYKGAV